jgi:hypothetical protein
MIIRVGLPHPLASRKSLRAGVSCRSAATTLLPLLANSFAKARLIPLDCLGLLFELCPPGGLV